MKEDKLLEEFFSFERWKYAMSRGVDKDIDKARLYKLCNPKVQANIYEAMKLGKYKIFPPHIALIPKDEPGQFRQVYVNEPVDRIILSIANDLLFDMMPEMISDRCKSYQRGIGCGSVVKEVSHIVSGADGVIGFKSDLRKYFDNVKIEYIDAAFDKVESKYGHSALIDVLRDYYHSDIYFDEDGAIQHKYQSLKQGCAVASWLADVILKDVDDEISKLNVVYYRYSDDTICIGPDYKRAMEVLVSELGKKGLSIHPVSDGKTQYIDKNHWFKFLGFSIKGKDISISATRLKTFQKEIESRTIRRRKNTLLRATNAVNRYLYKGDGQHSWATGILPVVNVKRDIGELNKFVMDCLRAVKTGKTKVGGLGFVSSQKDGCISRGTGRNVTANRKKLPHIDGYLSIGCAYNAIRTRRGAYNTLISQL